MKKRCFFLLLLLCGFSQVHAQVAVNTDGSAPDNSAMLDIKSTTKGLLIPRLTVYQRIQLPSPATGLLIYQHGVDPGFYYNGGTPAVPNWKLVGDLGLGWNTTGNSGTDATVNFIGTLDNVPLTFRVNNLPAGKIDHLTSNTSFGYQSLNSVTGGMINTAIGHQSLFSNTNGTWNVAIGHQALYANLEGYSNTAIGVQALYSNTSGIINLAIGMSALYSNLTGNDNVASGARALYSNTSGNQNTATGTFALEYNNTGIDNTAYGFNALNANTIGNNNSATGSSALFSNTEGSGNTANGFQAHYSNTKGHDNSAYGFKALYSNLEGTFNTAIGDIALYSNRNANGNTANGYATLYSNYSGYNNTANGREAMYHNYGGTNNTANGYSALYNNINGSNNTATGGNSLLNNTGGDNNTGIGVNAGISNTIGSNNTYIGYGTGGTNNISNSSAIGSGASVTASNTMVLGDPANSSFSVCIGRSHSASGYKLAVAGKVICEELKVRLAASWPDYVFDAKYPLMSIDELAKSIEREKHLPGLPSAEDVKKDGVSMGEMQAKLLEKVEQLTLYIIQLQKQNDELTKKDAEIMQMINNSNNGNH
ncbi:MAG: hypothetical protein WCK09_15980 [Bacteroidota bacterium]